MPPPWGKADPGHQKTHGRLSCFRRILPELTAGFILMLGPLGAARPGEAAIICTFTTTVPAPLAGTVRFSVSDSAIAPSDFRA